MSTILDLSQPSPLDKDDSMTGSRAIRIERTLLILWFVVNLIIGALTVHEYGMSIDEPNNYRYAADTLKAYPSLFGTLYEPSYDSSYDGHGPAFVTIIGIFVVIIQVVFPNVFAPDLWHFSYFITFQLTGLCLYWLAKRWFSTWAAWGILVLFSTQPVLLGHAFINPKDIPFMFFLTLSVVLGFRMADTLESKESFVSLEQPAQRVRSKFQAADPRRRKKFLFYLAVAVFITLALLVFSRQINSLIEQTVLFFYTAEPGSWPGRIFSFAGSSTVPVEDYINKALRLFERAEQSALIAGCLFFLAYFFLVINNTTLSSFLRKTWTQRHHPIRWKRLRAVSLKNWLTELFHLLRSSSVILAGVALGLATGVRAARSGRVQPPFTGGDFRLPAN